MIKVKIRGKQKTINMIVETNSKTSLIIIYINELNIVF